VRIDYDIVYLVEVKLVTTLIPFYLAISTAVLLFNLLSKFMHFDGFMVLQCYHQDTVLCAVTFASWLRIFEARPCIASAWLHGLGAALWFHRC